MKVMVVGQLGFGELGASLLEGFSRCGVQADGVDYMVEYNRSAFSTNRITSRLFRKMYANTMSQRIVDQVRLHRPDLVMVIKCHWLTPDAVIEMKKRSGAVFNYYPDSPFGGIRANSSAWLFQTLPRYDVVFTFAEHMIPQFKEIGCRQVVYLPFASDPGVHQVLLDDHGLEAYKCDISFVGNVDEERAKWLKPLMEYDLKLWGESYPASVLDDPVLRTKVQGKALYGADFAKAARASKISLNLMRKQNLGSHNMRTFEAPACRAFVLSQRTPEINRLFVEDKEAVYFSTTDELRAKVDFYLAHQLERDLIATAGWKRAASETYSRRAAQILAEYDALNAGAAL